MMDLVNAGRSRRNSHAFPSATPEVGVAPLQTATPLRQAGDTAANCVSVLAHAIRFGGPMDRAYAASRALVVQEGLLAQLRGSVGASPPHFGVGGHVESGLWTVRERLPVCGTGRLTRGHAATIYTGLTFVAGIVLVFGSVRLAAVLLMLRGFGSFLHPVPGTSADFTDPATADRGETTVCVVAWRSCVVGHICDFSTLLAIAGCLMVGDRTAWGVGVGLVVVFAMFGTLLRVAAVQEGIVLRRLLLERVLRTGSLLLGLMLAALLQPTTPTASVPVIAIAAIGTGLYACGEVARVLTTVRSARETDAGSSVETMILRRMANLLPVVERGAIVDAASIPSLSSNRRLAS